MSFTVVFFHAHPDDEALMTGGTMARLAAEGHRVVLVTATDGASGLAAADVTRTAGLGAVRRQELDEAARVLGCARTVLLGYRDSGSDPAGGPLIPADGVDGAAVPFSAVAVEDAARRLAEVLTEEAADAVVTYDPAGGYGHADHVQVHHVGVRAAEIAGTRVVLEATVDRRLLQQGLRWGRWFLPRVPDLAPNRFDSLYSASAQITHRVDVTRYLGQKRAGMRAHASQGTSDDGFQRGLATMLGLPRPLYRLAFGREWFVEHGRLPGRRPLGDLLSTLRSSS